MKYAFKIRFTLSIIIFILAVLGITGLFYHVKIFDIQFAPLLQRVLIDFSPSVGVLFGIIILLTLIFGRFYCSLICPFGILQELTAIISGKKNSHTQSYNFKYFIAAVVFGILSGGSAIAIRYIEPYTYFASAMSISVMGIIAAAAVIAVVFFKNRFFCTNICPVGTVLGLLAKISRYKIYINEDICISCGKCEQNCPAGCINSKEKIINNETCIKCLKCINSCPEKAVKYGKEPKKTVKFNLKRRQFIISAAAIALFGGMIKTGLIIKNKTVQKFKDIILPPGAASAENFINKCFNCNLCVSNCPNKIIKKADDKFPYVHIDFTKLFCAQDCNKCSQICPTGAIKKLSLEEKQKTKIATAVIDNEKCVNCGHCIYNCPFGAVIKRKDSKPVIDADKCIGCSKCKSQCYYNAINIYAVKEQNII